MGFTLSVHQHSHNDDLTLFPEAADLPTANHDREEEWVATADGQLAVDVIDAERDIIIRSPIAGVSHDDLEVFIHNDTLTIRGHRAPEEVAGRTLVAECHWGAFSRTLILPSEIDGDRIGASLKNGVLTITLPKIERSHRVEVREE